jgi:hypothetical protein
VKEEEKFFNDTSKKKNRGKKTKKEETRKRKKTLHSEAAIEALILRKKTHAHSSFPRSFSLSLSLSSD